MSQDVGSFYLSFGMTRVKRHLNFTWRNRIAFRNCRELLNMSRFSYHRFNDYWSQIHTTLNQQCYTDPDRYVLSASTSSQMITIHSSTGSRRITTKFYKCETVTELEVFFDYEISAWTDAIATVQLLIEQTDVYICKVICTMNWVIHYNIAHRSVKAFWSTRTENPDDNSSIHSVRARRHLPTVHVWNKSETGIFLPLNFVFPA